VQRSGMRDVGTPEQPAMLFTDAAEFRAWLMEHHNTDDSLMVALAKKHVPEPKLDWPRAVREALCLGWIDSQARRFDEDYTLQRFTPPRPHRRVLVRGRERGAATRLPGALGGKLSCRVVLGDGEAELPPHCHPLGGVGQATCYEGPENRPARRRLCGGSADPDAAVRDGAGLGGEGARGSGVTQDSRARRPARWRTSRMGRPRTASAIAVEIARPVSQPAVDVSSV
jgi:hypothetical protein